MTIGAVRADMQFGGTWQNVTSDMYTQEKIRITRGRQDEASSIEACALSLGLNNRSGNYSPGNPLGVHYGQIGVGTPIRVGIGTPPNAAFAFSTPAATTLVAPNVQTEAPGLLFNVTAEYTNNATPSNLVPSPSLAVTYPTLKGRISTVASGAVTTGAAGAYGAAYGATDSAASSAFGSAAVAASIAIPGPTSTAAIIAQQQSVAQSSASLGTAALALPAFNVTANDVIVLAAVWAQDPSNSMYAAPLDDQLDAEWSLITDSGPSSVYPRIQVWTRQCPRSVSALQIAMFGHFGHLEDLAVVAFQVRGATSWAPRFHGEAVSFDSTADLSGKDVRCALQAGNVIRRRGQGQDPVRSALYRSFTFNAAGVAGYWPLETNTALNQQGSSVLNSPLPGVGPAVFAAGASSAISYGATSTIPASDSLPTIQNGVLSFKVPAYTDGAFASTSSMVTAVFQLPSAPVSGAGMLVVNTDGGINFQVAFTNSTTLTLGAYASDNTLLGSQTFSLANVTGTGTTSFIGAPFAVALAWFVPQFGSMQICMNTVNMSGSNYNSPPIIGPFSALTVAKPATANVTSIRSGVDVTGNFLVGVPMTIGHVTVSSHSAINPNGSILTPTGSALPTFFSYGAFLGWAGEDAGERVLRLAQEESIASGATRVLTRATGDPFAAMGPQYPDTALNLIVEAATTDGGELFEARGYNGLHYRPVSAISGMPAVTTLDYAARMVADPFEPTNDDQHVRNDVQVSQRSGGIARSFLASGPFSIQPPPGGVGTYTSSVTVNVANENPQLQRTAEWLLHLGTDGSTRFKAIATKIAAVAGSANAISDIDIGQRITITNPPIWASGTGPVDLYVLGTDETIGDVISSEWDYTLTCIPFRPYSVFTVGGNPSGEFSRLDFTAASLNAGVTSGATSITITSLFTADFPVAGSCPFNINVGGERMTITAVAAPSGVTQVLTVTRAVNGVVKAQTAGTAVNVWQPAYLGVN